MLYARQTSRLDALWEDACKLLWIVLGLNIFYIQQHLYDVCFKCLLAFTGIQHKYCQDCHC